MKGTVMGSKRLTPTIVGKMASKCLLCCFVVVFVRLIMSIRVRLQKTGLNFCYG